MVIVFVIFLPILLIPVSMHSSKFFLILPTYFFRYF